MNKEQLEKLALEGKTIHEMATINVVAESKIKYWIKKHHIVRDRVNHRTWSNSQMKNAIVSSLTISDVLRMLGLKIKAGNYTTVRNFIREHHIDVSHMTGFRASTHNRFQPPLENILVKNSSYSRRSLKKRLLKLGLLSNSCSICGLSETWNRKPIIMVIDHINGDNVDNRIENLRMLCPNCNSQQSTFCGRARSGKIVSRKIRGRCSICGKSIYQGAKTCNKCRGLKSRKVIRPTKEELREMIKSSTWVEIGKRFSVSDNAIKKWAKSYQLV